MSAESKRDGSAASQDGETQFVYQLAKSHRKDAAAVVPSILDRAKSASGAVKSVPDVATLILTTLTGAIGCRRIHRS